MSKKKLYTEDSIESLSPLEFTRLRPGVYCGDISNPNQLLVEVLSNAVDEFRLGNGTIINISIDKDICTVEDFGQGFIVNSLRDDGKTILEAAFSVLNTSGKYRNDGTYEGTSLGSFGIGSKITTYLSHWLEVITYRDNKTEKILFKEGVFEKRELGKCDSRTGTVVKWQPSEEFFTTNIVEIKSIKSLLKTITALCKGLTINLNDNGVTTTYYSENGLNDLVDSSVGDTELINNRFNLNWNYNKNAIDLILTYTSSYSSTIVPYVNTGLTESGPHIVQVKNMLTREFNKFIRSEGWLKEKDDNLSGDDLSEGMFIIFNLTAPDVAYDAQVKSRITKIDMNPFTEPFTRALNIWFTNNKKDIKVIVDKAILARKAREAAKKAKEAIRNLDKKKDKVLKFDSKLADCYSKDRSKCEIYITEGDSASANLKTARNNEFQAVMPVRGKILNTQKATLEQLQKNDEIRTMIDAFGLDIDVKTMKIEYNPKKLRYDKIIIMSDADVR